MACTFFEIMCAFMCVFVWSIEIAIFGAFDLWISWMRINSQWQNVWENETRGTESCSQKEEWKKNNTNFEQLVCRQVKRTSHFILWPFYLAYTRSKNSRASSTDLMNIHTIRAYGNFERVKQTYANLSANRDGRFVCYSANLTYCQH